MLVQGAADRTSVCQAEGRGATETPGHGEGLDGHLQPGGGLAATPQPRIHQLRWLRGPGSAKKLSYCPKKLNFPQLAKITCTPDQARSLTPHGSHAQRG